MPDREQVEVMFNLEGRVAIVTGGAQGIGRAIALNLAEGGASIALTNTQSSKLDEVIKEIEGNHFRLISDREQIKDSQYMLVLGRD